MKQIPGVGAAILCGRTGKPCRFCRRPATALCDHPLPPDAKRTTCDAPMCDAHRWPVPGKEDVEYCPEHKPE